MDTILAQPSGARQLSIATNEYRLGVAGDYYDSYFGAGLVATAGVLTGGTVDRYVAFEDTGRIKLVELTGLSLSAAEVGGFLSGGDVAGLQARAFAGADRFLGSAESDWLMAYGGNDTLVGYGGADTLDGGAGNNRLNGGDGNDLLLGGRGNDLVIGGAGIDTLDFSALRAGVTVDLGLSGAQDTGGAGIDTISGIEILIGSAHADQLSGDAAENLLEGGAGNDRLDGGEGWDTLVGGSGNDTYVVDGNGDLIVETSTSATEVDSVISRGECTLGALLENLTLTGTADVAAYGNERSNRITGNDGRNVVSGGGGGDDTLAGGAGNDVVAGGDGKDWLDGGFGVDTLYGGGGDDVYVVDAPGDLVADSGGVDTVRSSVDRTLGSELEKLVLTGSVAVRGNGNALDNGLTGNGVANRLAGGSGNDTLNGAAGADTLTGGSGIDVFRLGDPGSTDVTSDLASGVDRVVVLQGAIRVGDGDARVEAGVSVPGAGGFGAASELVVVTGNVAGPLTAAAAAARIGSATGAYHVGDTALFVVDNGVDSALFLFTAADADAAVEAGELSLLLGMSGTASTALGDYLFG